MNLLGDKMKKTILLVPGFVCDTWCTIENYTLELTKVLSDDFNIIWLVSNINNPYNVFKNKENREVLKEPVCATEAKKNDIQVINADLSKYNLLKNIFVLNKIFKQYNVDAIYTEFGFERYMATICTKLLGKKTIFRAHGSLGGNYKNLKYIIHSLFVDVFLPVSNYTATFIPKHKKQCVIHNSIDIKKKKELSLQELFNAKKKLGLEKFEKIIVMIAKFDEGKRHNIALNIIERVISAANKNVGFVFLGTGDLYEYYLNEIRNRNLQDVIYAPGYTNDVDKYLEVSDISMLTSLEEGLPCSFLESMNYSLPLIAFNKIWAQELITNEFNGYLINIDNTEQYAKAILELIDNEQKMKNFGNNSYKILNKSFNMNLWQQKMKEIFNKIMN